MLTSDELSKSDEDSRAIPSNGDDDGLLGRREYNLLIGNDYSFYSDKDEDEDEMLQDRAIDEITSSSDESPHSDRTETLDHRKGSLHCQFRIVQAFLWGLLLQLAADLTSMRKVTKRILFCVMGVNAKETKNCLRRQRWQSIKGVVTTPNTPGLHIAKEIEKYS